MASALIRACVARPPSPLNPVSPVPAIAVSMPELRSIRQTLFSSNVNNTLASGSVAGRSRLCWSPNLQIDLIPCPLRSQSIYGRMCEPKSYESYLCSKEAGWAFDYIQWEPIAGQKDRELLSPPDQRQAGTFILRAQKAVFRRGFFLS